MRNIVDYFIGSNGKLWVRTDNGKVRRATHAEWLGIWRRDPRLTLMLAG